MGGLFSSSAALPQKEDSPKWNGSAGYIACQMDSACAAILLRSNRGAGGLMMHEKALANALAEEMAL